jgi:hypothetical protein
VSPCANGAAARAGAQAEFEAALAADPGDAVALNNCALCRMYACDLGGAIQARGRAPPRRMLPQRPGVCVGCLCCRLIMRVMMSSTCVLRLCPRPAARVPSDEAPGAAMCCVMRLYVAQHVSGTGPGCLDEAAGMARCCTCFQHICSTFKQTCSTGPGGRLARSPARAAASMAVCSHLSLSPPLLRAGPGGGAAGAAGRAPARAAAAQPVLHVRAELLVRVRGGQAPPGRLGRALRARRL